MAGRPCVPLQAGNASASLYSDEGEPPQDIFLSGEAQRKR
jgi:hypothetical protein